MTKISNTSLNEHLAPTPLPFNRTIVPASALATFLFQTRTLITNKLIAFIYKTNQRERESQEVNGEM